MAMEINDISQSQGSKGQKSNFRQAAGQKSSNLPFQVHKPTFVKSSTYSRQGHWSLKEKLRFCIFMDFHRETFTKRENRRLFKIFKCMAEFVKTRNPNQCRSHHQKMEKQYEDLQSYIASISNAWSRETYERFFNLYSEELIRMEGDLGMDQIQEEQAQQKADSNVGKQVQNQPTKLPKQDEKKTQEVTKHTDYTRKTDQKPTTQPLKKMKAISFFGSNGQNWGMQQAECLPIAMPNFSKHRFVQQDTPAYSAFKNYEECPSRQFKSNIQGSERERILSKCDYYWKKWMSSVIELEQHVQKTTNSCQ